MHAAAGGGGGSGGDDGAGADAKALQRAPRLFVPHSLLQLQAPVSLSSDQQHYLSKVMRLRPGAYIRAFNEQDGEWACVCVNDDHQHEEGGAPKKIKRPRGKNSYNKDLTILATRQLRPSPSTDTHTNTLRLCFAPIKKTRLKILLEKATEIGVTHLQPVLTDYTDIKDKDEYTHTHTDTDPHEKLLRQTDRDTQTQTYEKMEAVLVEAAEQCERMTIPKIMPSVGGLDALFASLGNEEKGKGREKMYICRERAGVRPLWEVLQEMGESGGGEGKGKEGWMTSFLVGPEGGFSPAELALLDERKKKKEEEKIECVSLGPSVLRAETAAMVALGVYVAWRDAQEVGGEGR